MDHKFLVHSKQVVFNGFFKIVEALVSYRRFNGEMSKPVKRLVFERGDAAAALIYNPAKQTVVLTYQFRFPTTEKNGGWVLETAAGMVEEGEDGATTIRREIMEETGYQVDCLEPISSFYVSPGGSSERILLYYAEVTEKVGGGGGVGSEDIEIREMSVENFLGLLDRGLLNDGKTIIAAMYLRNRLLGK